MDGFTVDDGFVAVSPWHLYTVLFSSPRVYARAPRKDVLAQAATVGLQGSRSV